jgi:prepilin-type N-terminal cleavage/methylation domain-containing protein
MKNMNKKGVTLIELIVVIAIIAIGALLISPNFGRWISYYRLRTATRDVVSTLRVAQMKAVSNNIQYRVNFDSAEIGTANSYLLQFQTTAGWSAEGTIQSLPNGITFDGIPTFPSYHAEFNPNSSSSAGTVKLKNSPGTAKKSVVVASTGRIRIAE